MNSRTKSTDAAVQLNSLLRGEISAVETYAIAEKKLADDRSLPAQQIREIAQEHGRHAQTLRERIRALGGIPDESSGAWGAYVKAVESAASLLGDRAALKALLEGEEHGLKDYLEASDDVDGATAALIAERFVPAQNRHIEILRRSLDSDTRSVTA